LKPAAASMFSLLISPCPGLGAQASGTSASSGIASSGVNSLMVSLLASSCQKKTYDRTTTFLRQRALAGAVGSMQAVWNDQRETEPSVTES
jgi:hypothetical protein